MRPGAPGPPTLAVTLGDPAGIGPEICEKALQTLHGRAMQGDAENSLRGVRIILVGPSGLADAIAARVAGDIEALVLPSFEGPVGCASAESGRAAWGALDAAIGLVKQGVAHGLATAPIAKTALALAGYAARGHTEILTEHLAEGPVAMAFFSERLRVALVTTHIPLCEVSSTLTTNRIVEVGRLFYQSLVDDWLIPTPRVAVAALNPHAGENGLLGHEDMTLVTPAVAALQSEVSKRGQISGPHVPDVVFRQALVGNYDGVVAMYHDQGLIPLKLLGLGSAVHMTLGLKVPRTSPDHGTAFDIAGQGVAEADGMTAAIEAAALLMKRRLCARDEGYARQ